VKFGMQRDLQAIKAAHKMDPRRVELYVEGRRDRLFFLWLLGPTRPKGAIVLEIGSVAVDADGQNSQREKLMRFARQASTEELNIRCFADADFDRLRNIPCPSNVWLTDFRDLEGYFLQEHCIRKILLLAVVSVELTPATILSQVRAIARPLGVLRLLSIQEDLKLPFQARPPDRNMTKTDRGVEIDFEAYLQTLLQDANISLKKLEEIKAKHSALLKEMEKIPDSELMHGKDCIAVIEKFLESKDFKRDAIEPCCWTSLEPPLLADFSNLNAALAYLRSGSN
jgi:hypothetical protein